jgi:ubiquinone/menaquinone biosynthesis C-methylase UbiE
MAITNTIINSLNKLFPQKNVGGRKSPLDYSLTEYGWAQNEFSSYSDLLQIENKVVLDAGCGLGGRTAFYSEKGAESVFAIDIDENHVKFAKEFADYKNSKNITFRQANFIDIPFESDKFDVILLNDVLEHIKVDYLERALLELQRVLKPGGKIYMEFPPWSSPYAAHLYDHIAIPWCHLLFSDKSLIRFVESKKSVDRMGRLSSIDHFKELNRLEKKQFVKMMKKLNFVEVYFKQRIIKNMNFFKVIPGLNNILTQRIIGIYTKNKAG